MGKQLISLGFIAISDVAGAQGPLTIEQLMVDRSRWQLVSGYEFRSATPVAGSTVESSGWNMALRYGVSNRVELSARLGMQERRAKAASASFEQRIDGLSVGGNWLVHRESAVPALLLEMNSDFSADTTGGGLGLRTIRWALTSYRTLDPLVLSLTVAGRLEQARQQGSAQVRDGNGYRVDARVNFAVNPRVTLFGGVSFDSFSAPRVNGQPQARPAASVGLNSGLAFAATPRHTIFVDADVAPQLNASGMSLRWFLDF